MKNYSLSFFLLLVVLVILAGCSDDKEEVVAGGGTSPSPPVVNNANDPPIVEDPTKIPVIEVPREGAPSGPFAQGNDTGGLEEEPVDQKAVMFLVEEYLVNFEKAVNDGAFVYISHLLDPESELYREQIDYVLEMYERQITEQIINYQIGVPVKVAEDTYEVTVQETYSIHYGGEGREEVKNFENIYTVKWFEAVWLIHDLVVNVIE